jgi:hypothetical protein
VTTINKVDYHRNGVAGRGFYVALVDDPFGESAPGRPRDPEGSGEFLVIMFPEYDPETDKYVTSREYTAVLKLSLLMDRCIEFGPNSWRGDRAAGACGDMILAAAEAQFEAKIAQWMQRNEGK